MLTIPFVKYTHCGNNFVIVDEVSQPHLPEREKPLFAYQASDVSFGIGSDGLLVIQPFNTDVLQGINNAYSYWNTPLIVTENCNYIFRLFESNMMEALACGNGLLCIISYLYERYGIDNACIMTEVPLAHPNIITIGVQRETKLCWCNLGYPRRVPEDVIPYSVTEYYKEQVDIVYGLKIGFRSHDLHSFTEETPLLLSCYLTFTGEPHLVIFPDECMPAELANTIFASFEATQREKRRNFGTWLVNHIGAYINKHYHDRFPVGVNVNFARILNTTAIIQYRCYERGINRETLACGTGAIAVSHIAKVLRLIADDNKTVAVMPYLCNYYEPNARLLVTTTDNGMLLNGKPSLLFAGKFMYRGAQKEADMDDKELMCFI
jgi:diaminopimelate epimerase